jgi:DNA-binding NarL/FixJ family response regulator
MSDTKRNRAIVKRVAAGTSIKAIADEFGITKQRVSQIYIGLTGERQPQTYL